MSQIVTVMRFCSIAGLAAFSNGVAAGEADLKDTSRLPSAGDWRTEAVRTHIAGHRYSAGKSIPSKDQVRLGIGPAGRQVGVSYDPAHNMVRLHVPLHGKGDFDRGHQPGWSFFQAKHSERENRHLFGRPEFQSVDAAVSNHTQSADLISKSVSPTLNRFNHALNSAAEEATTTMSKTSLPFDQIAFAPFEVLGVNLDAASIEKARVLGFQPEASKIGGGSVTRLFAPPNIDAIRAQELLGKELPGQRFELNKIYRLYRASMREETGSNKGGETPPSSQGCPPERCFSRTLIQWDDNLSPCARGLRIGVIDTGFDVRHPALVDRRIHKVNFVPEGRLPASDWHGTGVLTILAGTPRSGTPGLVPDADFYAASIFFADRNGGLATDSASLIKALAWMRDNNVKLINMSFTGPRDDLVREAIEDLSARGVTFVAAAGNDGPTADPAYPAAYPQVIAVTAVTKELRNYRYANRGAHIDVSAPGVDIWTAVPEAREGFHTGTSFAAPHVTGAIAVMPREALNGNKNELLDSMPIQDLGDPGRDPIYGRGLLTPPSSCTPPSEEIISAAASFEPAR